MRPSRRASSATRSPARSSSWARASRASLPASASSRGTEFGGYASQVVVPADGVLALPDGLTFEQGAAIPVNYGTAWMGLLGFGSLQAGERVLIHAAAGGVGIAATQVAKRQGAEVYGTASPGKHARISELGVDHALDYTKSGWERGLPQFDVIMDAIGGKSFRRSYELLGPGGRLIAFGASAVVSGERRNPVAALSTAVRMPRFNLIKQMSASKAVIGLNMYTLSQDERRRAEVGAALRELLDDGTVQPVVAGDVLLRGSRRRAQHDHRTAQRRQGRARPLRRGVPSPLRCARCYSASQMSFQLSSLLLLLLPPRGE